MEKEKDTRTPCLRQELDAQGRFTTCGGHYEIRVPVYFDRHIIDGEQVLKFSVVGDTDDSHPVVMNCTDCGKPAPRILYAGIDEPLLTLWNKLKEALA